MPRLSIEDLTQRFSLFRVAFVFAEPLTIAPHRSAALAEEIAAAEAECRRRWGGMELSAIPEVAAWRAAYKGFGIKRTSYRSSVERLIKRVVAGQPLPSINALVDLTTWCRWRPASASAATTSTGLLATSFSASLGPATASSTWAPNRATIRMIRRRKARSSTPTPGTCSAGGGTGARILAPPLVSRPGAGAGASVCQIAILLL